MSEANEMEFTAEELLSQAQGNATGLALASIAYAKAHDLAVEEYVTFVGRLFAPGWEEQRGAPVREVARTAALNFVSVGARLGSFSGDDERAEALVTGWPEEAQLSELGLTRADSEPFWDIYEPIMEHLGIRYAWERQEEAVRMTFERGGTE
jgi:hypothetical protein